MLDEKDEEAEEEEGLAPEEAEEEGEVAMIEESGEASMYPMK